MKPASPQAHNPPLADVTCFKAGLGFVLGAIAPAWCLVHCTRGCGGARRGGGAGMALAVGTVEVCTRNRISPIAVEQQPPSRDPTTRPLRTTEEPAPSVTLPPTSVHVIVWCGDKPVVLRSLGGRCERHKRASRAWSACWPASPKGRVESEPRGPSQLQGVRGVSTHRTVPITNRHDLSWFERFRSHFALFWSFRLAISEPGWTSREKKSPTWNPA